ncbi:DsrE/DsrF/DrsH-like family protein [candidate division KSB1 bacterium]|nr:DsrE/DsrF/DrsH-like family protein [candidate division KSB1 bacterium]
MITNGNDPIRVNPDGDKNMLTLVVFSGDLDKILASFIIATGAAASGMKVNMFFTFWGLKLIHQEGKKVRGVNWMQRVFGWMVKPGPNNRPISRLNMGGMGAMMLKAIMKKSRIPGLKEMLQTAHSLGIKMTACSTSMGVMGIPKDNLIPEVTNIAGVASFLADAKDSAVTLFI